MKRIFTLLCALILLLSSFSGMVVSAAEIDAAASETVVAAEETETPETAAVAAVKLPDGLREYLKEQFALCKSSINISQFQLPYDGATIELLINEVLHEIPELFHVMNVSVSTEQDGIIPYLYPDYHTYGMFPEKYDACLKKMQEGAEYLLRGVKGNDALSEVEKALVLHDRLAVWTEQDTVYKDSMIDGAYGALGNQKAVSKGYTMAYMYLLEQVGIESDYCYSAELNQAWNIVYISGKPYYADVTRDDPLEAYGEDLDIYADPYGSVQHENFLRSATAFRNLDHNADDVEWLDAGTEYNSGHFWTEDLQTSVELIGNDLYYMTCGSGGNVVWKVTDSEPVAVFTTDRYHDGKLSSVGRMLLVSREKDVLLVNPANGQSTVVCTPEIARGEFVSLEGMKFEKNKIWLHAWEWYADYYMQETVTFVDTSDGLTIDRQPETAVAPDGSKAKITLEVGGYGLTYAWYYKKAGASSFKKSGNQLTNTLSLKMTSAWDGAQFYCVVSDMYGNTVQSKTVTMYMGNPAKITTQPANGAAPKGSTAKTTLKATGDGLTYTWYYMKSGATQYTKSGNQLTNTLSLKMSAAWDGAKFYCVVTDKYGTSVKSSTVKLYMGTPVKITTQPKETIYAPSGGTAKIPLKASGSGLKYTWYYMKSGATKYTKSGNQTTNTLSLKMSSAWNGAKFYCVVTDKYGVSVKSGVATLRLGNPATITTQPSNVAVAKNKTAKVTLKATGDGISYAWYYKDKTASKFTKATVKTATYSVKMTTKLVGRQVYCVVKDKYGNQVKSSVVTLYIGTPAKITTQPKSTYAFSGKTIKATVKASGSGLKYAWYYMKKDATKYTKSGNQTTNTLSIKMSATWDGAKFYCVVTDKYGISVKSSVVTFTLAKKATITTQPKSVKTYNGETAKVSVKATGDGLTYQWYYAKKGSSSFQKISGATKSSYSVKMSSSVNGRKVYCVVKDKYGNSVKTSTVTLSMHAFDPIGAITGTWKSYAVYIPGYGNYELTGTTIKITSDKKATLTIKGDGVTNTFKFTWSFEELVGDEAYYSLKGSVEDVYVVYSKTEKELAVVTQSGETIVFKK